MKFLTRSIQKRRLSKLLKSLANDDSSALRKIYDDYATAILIHCKNVHLSDERAAEILQNFTLKMWNGRKEFIDPRKFAKFFNTFWREITFEAVQSEAERRLQKATGDEADSLKKLLSINHSSVNDSPEDH